MRRSNFFKDVTPRVGANDMGLALKAAIAIEVVKKAGEVIIEDVKETTKKMKNINKQEGKFYQAITQDLDKAANDETVDTENNNAESQSFKP